MRNKYIWSLDLAKVRGLRRLKGIVGKRYKFLMDALGTFSQWGYVMVFGSLVTAQKRVLWTICRHFI